MKKKHLFAGIALAAGLFCLTGCGGNSETPTKSVETSTTTAVPTTTQEVVIPTTTEKIEEPTITSEVLSEIEQIYQLYLNNGGTLTYEDWLASIKGEKGDKGEKGEAGKDGQTPYIGTNGNWWIGTTDTGVKAAGTNGNDGKDGKDGVDGEDSLSAYQLYLKYHSDYCGTEEEWVNDLAEGKLNTKIMITFDSDGGNAIHSVETSFRSIISSPQSPFKDGYDFVSWQLEDSVFDFSKPVTESITLKAIWSVAKTSVDSLLLSLKDDGTYEVVGLNDEHDTELVVPSTYNDIDITSVGAAAFEKGSDIQSIYLGDKVTSISDSAFNGCGVLTELNIYSLSTYLGKLFGTTSYTGAKAITQDDVSYKVPSNLKELTIRSGSIPTGALMNFTTLETVSLINVTGIGSYAFLKCTNLKEINISDTISFIGERAFRDTAISSIAFPENSSLTSVPEQCFYGCTNLATIELPSNIVEIDDSAFSNCTSLTTIDFPDSLKVISTEAFKSCYKLKSVDLPTSVQTIGRAAFFGCSNLNSIAFPDSVTSVGDAAFYGCTNIELITFSANMKDIGGSGHYAGYFPRGMFSSCKVKSIVIPDGATKIGAWVFSGCSQLASVSIPESVTIISEYAFENCTSLSSIDYGGTMDEWNSISFDYQPYYGTYNTSDSWYSGSSIRTIHCIDGDITL